MTQKKFRIHFWVDPKVQVPYLLSILGFSVMTCLGVGALFYLFLIQTNGVFVAAIIQMLPHFPLQGEKYLTAFSDLLVREKLIVTWTYGIVFASMGVGAILVGVFFSHRYAGPVINFKNTIQEITRTKTLKHVHLRKTDEIRDIMNEFNRMIDALKQSKERDKQQMVHCRDLARHLLRQGSVGPVDREVLKKIADI